ncbi:hypothetical protein BpHYR1_003702 [Brachionus plicatilis]|uniref:Uncharacterized protein n=1 Tax=Brachionus plicatilis TaxID=10195 RepID=A0A3M7RE05_BRAPC|nr:hypothetical protein BpHYR1_003702 [Brachionus plicatilis]
MKTNFFESSLTDEDIIGNIEAKNIDTSTDYIAHELVETITEPESITSKDAIEMISKLRDFFVRKTEDCSSMIENLFKIESYN